MKRKRSFNDNLVGDLKKSLKGERALGSFTG